jgi:hypothetical protein
LKKIYLDKTKISLVVVRGGRSRGGHIRGGHSRGSRAVYPNDEFSDIDDVSLINDLKDKNIDFKLPTATRNKMIKLMKAPTFINSNHSYNEDDREDRINLLEKKIDLMQQDFKLINIVGNLAGNLTIYTSNFFF